MKEALVHVAAGASCSSQAIHVTCALRLRWWRQQQRAASDVLRHRLGELCVARLCRQGRDAVAGERCARRGLGRLLLCCC